VCPSCGLYVRCHQALFQKFKDSEIPVLEMSTLTGEGVMEARTEVTRRLSVVVELWQNIEVILFS